MNKKLRRYILDHLVCFGPKKLGSNLLINTYDHPDNSFFRTILRNLALLGQNIAAPDFKLSKEECAKIEDEIKAKSLVLNSLI